MSGSVLASCALAISGAQLSSLRDGELGAAATARLREHCATCPACQAQLAAFDAVGRQVRAQHYAGPDDRLWRGVQRRIAAKEHSPPMPKKTLLWSGASVAAILVVLATVIFTQFGRRMTVARVTPTLTPFPAGAILTPEQAWGDQYATKLTVNIGFHLDDVLPDGSGAIGDTALPGKPASIVLIPFQTGQVQILATTPYGLPQDGRIVAKTDGRYVAWVQNASAITIGYTPPTSIAYLDRQTGAIRPIPATPNDHPILDALDHGILIWQRPGQGLDAGMYITNLAANQTTWIAIAPASPHPDFVGFAWPNLVVADPAPASQAYVYNVQTSAAVAIQVAPNRQISMLDGDTLYWGTTAVDHAQSKLVMWEYDGVGLPGAAVQSKELFTLSGAQNQFPEGIDLQANDRLIAWRATIAEGGGEVSANVMWDRAQRREVQIVNCVFCPLNFLGYTMPFIRGNTLVYATVEAGKVTFYITDTDALRR